MAVIYGWTYAEFNGAVGWDKGNETQYLLWENSWSQKVNDIVTEDPATNITDAGNILTAKNIVNEMMIRTNAFLRGDETSGDNTNLYGTPGFPYFYKSHLKTLKNMKAKKAQKVLGYKDFDINT